jgi:hypothetical protein
VAALDLELDPWLRGKSLVGSSLVVCLWFKLTQKYFEQPNACLSEAFTSTFLQWLTIYDRPIKYQQIIYVAES